MSNVSPTSESPASISPNGVPAATVVRPRKIGYMRSLDGWRAFAILAVMVTHDRAGNLFGHSSAMVKGYGGYGVYLFFAISGFLITTRILEEEKTCGYFDIRRFYIRRIFRIQPAALAYLAAVAVLVLLGIFHDSWQSWLAALLLVNNFTYHTWSPEVLTRHFWTLAVEEHFYILLSLALLVVRRHRAWVLGLMFAGSLLVLQLYWLVDEAFQPLGIKPSDSPRGTQWRIGSLLLAALVAVWMQREALQAFVRKVLKPWVAFVMTPVLMVAHNIWWQLTNHVFPVRPFLALHVQIDFMAGYLLILWVVATVFHPHSLTTRLLETAPLRFIGKISYSLYLWHVMVYRGWGLLFVGSGPFAHLQAGHLPYTLLERPMRIALSFAVATLSYYYIELPMIRMGHKRAPAATPGRPELADLPVEQPRLA